MKSLLFSMALFVSPIFAYTSVHSFRCATTQPMYEGKIHTLNFKIQNLYDGKMALVKDPRTEEVFLKLSPIDSPFVALLDNWSFSRSTSGFRWTGDADGVHLVELVLYKNSDYMRGYLKLEDLGASIGSTYSSLRCSKRELE